MGDLCWCVEALHAHCRAVLQGPWESYGVGSRTCKCNGAKGRSDRGWIIPISATSSLGNSLVRSITWSPTRKGVWTRIRSSCLLHYQFACLLRCEEQGPDFLLPTGGINKWRLNGFTTVGERKGQTRMGSAVDEK
jgi:hypothetical protein